MVAKRPGNYIVVISVRGMKYYLAYNDQVESFYMTTMKTTAELFKSAEDAASGYHTFADRKTAVGLVPHFDKFFIIGIGAMRCE